MSYVYHIILKLNSSNIILNYLLVSSFVPTVPLSELWRYFLSLLFWRYFLSLILSKESCFLLLTLPFFFLLVSVFSLTFIKLSLSSEGWENFSFKKESLPTSQFYIFPQALNSLIFFPFKMRKSLARNWLDVRTGASGSSNLSDSFNKPILLSGLLHIEQDLPPGPPGRKVSL